MTRIHWILSATFCLAFISRHNIIQVSSYVVSPAAIPRVIQGGMGVRISHWRLAREVSKMGELGVVSGTAMDHIFVRELQDGK
mmetsp:Transcript_54043/g.65241  ORF Transcript_54043/g.65241 Transcript_54043/m.65241 type:complete len:83 (+) Transcript_54043:490-738(+)